MLKRLATIAMIILFFVSGFGQQIKIYKIQFEGLINARKEELKSLIDLREGQLVNERILNNALKKMYGLDMFKKVELFLSNTTEGHFVKFVVEENPYLKSIKFEGNKSIARDDLLKEMKITEESFLTEQKIKSSLAAIERKYRSEGFLDVIVNLMFMI